MEALPEYDGDVWIERLIQAADELEREGYTDLPADLLFARAGIFLPAPEEFEN